MEGYMGGYTACAAEGPVWTGMEVGHFTLTNFFAPSPALVVCVRNVIGNVMQMTHPTSNQHTLKLLDDQLLSDHPT